MASRTTRGPRKAPGTVRRSYSLPAELVEALEETADELDIGPGVLVRYAITGYLNNLDLPAAGALHSDRMNAAVAPIARRPDVTVEELTTGELMAALERDRPGVPLRSGFEPELGGQTHPAPPGRDMSHLRHRLPGHYGGADA